MTEAEEALGGAEEGTAGVAVGSGVDFEAAEEAVVIEAASVGVVEQAEEVPEEAEAVLADPKEERQLLNHTDIRESLLPGAKRTSWSHVIWSLGNLSTTRSAFLSTPQLEKRSSIASGTHSAPS